MSLWLGLGLLVLPLTGLPQTKTITDSIRNRIRLGNEQALSLFPSHLKGCRVGLVINHTSVLADGTPLLEAFLGSGIEVSAVFSPEHGFSGKIEGGMTVKDTTLKTLPVFSLYGKTKKPTSEQLKKIDVFVYDIQDVGTRFYTYITTLKYVLEAAAEAEKHVYVLDRPNPLGGIIVEGPLLKDPFRSYIGPLPLPVRYGLTPGELALMMKGEQWIPQGLSLKVLPMTNWKRSHYWQDTGLPWIPTSPNIPSPESAIAFPGTGLLGGIILNQGLGTSHPFLQFGAPWLDTERLRQCLNDIEAYGIQLENILYTPLSLPGKVLHPPYENRECRGLRIRILDKNKFRSVHFILAVIRAIKEIHPENLSLQADGLTRLFGDDILARYIKGDISFENMMDIINVEEESFSSRRRKYLLYD